MQDDKTWLYIVGAVVVLVIVYLAFSGGNKDDPADDIPSFNSTSAEWIEWHKQMLAFGYPKETANKIWLRAFNQYASDQWEANDYTLRNYASSQGMNVQGYSVVSGAYDSSIDTGKSLSKGVGTIGTMFALGIFVTVIIVVGAGFLLLKGKM
jgi:hypothetical protein